jgi:hypothetical protein
MRSRFCFVLWLVLVVAGLAAAPNPVHAQANSTTPA